MERVDVVVVGARLAGCALAAPLARAGRRVLVLDRMRFPSDQLSTHVLMPAGTSELARMGALPRILALNPSRVRYVQVEVDGVVVPRARCARPPTGSTSASACRATCRTSSSWRRRASRAPRCASAAPCRRCAGARGASRACATATPTGTEREVGATLVVGADGRRSTVASLVGAWTPYRLSRNGRGLVFRYMDDPRAGTSTPRPTASGARATRSPSRSPPRPPAGC